MDNKLVSVIIPTFKGSENICLAVDSVLDQEYKQVEVIVVDDNGRGSQEQIRTAEVMEQYKLDKRVKYICHDKNINGSAARNTGIKAARGNYIALLDDDDLFYPSKIRLQYEALSKSDERVGFCYTAFDIHFPDSRRMLKEATITDDICYKMLCNKVSIPSSVLMFKKSAWNHIGGFDESFTRHQDWEFLVRLSKEYDAVAINISCLKRVILKRNSPQNPEKYRYLREYYLDKMKPIILGFSKKQQRNIYFIHYTSISKEYLKEKNLELAFKYIIKSGKPLLSMLKLFKDSLLYARFKLNRST